MGRGNFSCSCFDADDRDNCTLVPTDKLREMQTQLAEAQATITALSAPSTEQRLKDWETLFEDGATPERALAFLRIWATGYLLKGNYWDVPHTMGNALGHATKILEATITALSQKLTEAKTGRQRWAEEAQETARAVRNAVDAVLPYQQESCQEGLDRLVAQITALSQENRATAAEMRLAKYGSHLQGCRALHCILCGESDSGAHAANRTHRWVGGFCSCGFEAPAEAAP